MNFFAYGCSYTVGSELADTIFSKMPREETEILKKNIGELEFYNRYVTDDREKQYIELMNKKSYAQTIADTINADLYINRAIRGSSNMHMFYQILEDIKTKTITKNDIIFVGYTSFKRYTWYDKHRIDFRSTTPSSEIWPSKQFQKQYILNMSDQDCILQNIQAYYAIKEITKEFKYFYQTVQWPYTYIYKSTEINKTLFSSLEEIDANALVPNHCMYRETPNFENWQNYSYTFGHPYEEYHKTFGKKLGEAILEKFK